MIKKIELQNFKKFTHQEIDFTPDSLSLIVGGNNSGKSSILHALAVWEYCKTVLTYEKSPSAILRGFHGDGYGVNIDDFTPINIPSLKYLWANLNPSIGYNLSIKCFWDNQSDQERYLKIGLALAQERLFIKTLESNIESGEMVPRIAYLPPFAGITDKEQWHSPAYRNKLIGQGLAGAVIRNTIIELYKTNQQTRSKLQGDKKRISKEDLANLRSTDSFEVLNKMLIDTFKGLLVPQDFNPDFHTNIKIDFAKGIINNNRFLRYSDYNKRDIMVEGSGFLQWLSVYTFAINPAINVLLLDEPDAHLHNSLQGTLIGKLRDLSLSLKKQILIATHSTEVVKSLPHNIILHIDKSIKYLADESQKIKVLSGLGTEFFPKIDKLQKYRRVLFVENNSDAELLKAWSINLQLNWPENIVIWPFASQHKERKQLFSHIKDEIIGIKCISLVDRDNNLYEQTSIDLHENYLDFKEGENEFRFRKWRRWEIENYLISPPAISRLANQSDENIRTFITENFSIVIPENYLLSDKTNMTCPLFDEGKPIISKICENYKLNKFEIAKEMRENEIFDDVKTLIHEIHEMCKTNE